MSKRKPLTLDDYAEELIGWAWGWLKGERVPFSQRKRFAQIVKEREAKQATYERQVFSTSGMYLYSATLSHFDKYISSDRILPYPQKRAKSIRYKPDAVDLMGVGNFLLDVGPQAGQMAEYASKHVFADMTMGFIGEGIRSPEGATNVMKQLGNAHESHLIQRMLGKVYCASEKSRKIQYSDLRFKGQRGDVIAEAHAKGRTLSRNTAHVWIVTTQNPHSIEKNTYVDPERAFIFFSEANAKLFMRNSKAYFSREAVKKFATSKMPELMEQDLQSKQFLYKSRSVFVMLKADLEKVKLKIDKKIEEIQHKMQAHPDEKMKGVYTYMINSFRDQKAQLKKLQDLAAIVSKNFRTAKPSELSVLIESLFQIQDMTKYYMMKYMANDRPAEGVEEVLMQAFNHFGELYNINQSLQKKKEEKEEKKKKSFISRDLGALFRRARRGQSKNEKNYPNKQKGYRSG